jgi:SAM-dependent methyltransferase
MEIDLEQVAREHAPDVAHRLLSSATDSANEAEFRLLAAAAIEDSLAAAGLSIEPRHEYSVASGRVDSLYNKLIIEYKAPGKIRESNEGKTNQEIIAQTQGYVLDVAKKQKKEANRLAGVATDGFHFIFMRRFGESWAVDEPERVSAVTTEKFLRLLFSLSTGKALIPENLIEDFGPSSLRARRAVKALYQALHANLERTAGKELVGRLFEQWKTFFAEATEYTEWSARIEAKEEFRSFVSGMGLDPQYVEASKVFFALHTYYALLVKLVASLAAARFAGAGETKPLAEFQGKNGGELRQVFSELEHGGLFRQFGIRNFLEGDFFGWYVLAWDASVEEAVSRLVQPLSEYDPGTLELAPENARDLLKNLYHSLLPREVRHDLGEYYTPDWLAEHVIRQTMGPADLGDGAKRVLDPSCGSGTFLLFLIRFIRQRAERNNQAPADTLRSILDHVVGFDLNPLAVIAARTNYLLALGDLLKHRVGDIDIPVFQADSVLTPSRGQEIFDGDAYPIETSVGVFSIPASFTSRGRLTALANELDQAVEDGVAPASFLGRLRAVGNAELDDQTIEAAAEPLAKLYARLKELHDKGLNGVWARIIKNAFAPLFQDPFHYVVGNPPWVNWESLPDRYRSKTKRLWEHYRLFVHSGMDTILGKGKKDISMLMTLVAGDRYLRPGGKLGFVISQSLLKTSGAAQGLRKFELPDKTPIGPVLAEDLVDINPFEGATNRTAVLVLAKGKKAAYPVEYVRWTRKAKGRGSRIPPDGILDEILRNRVVRTAWAARPVSDQDPTTAWMSGRPVALDALRRVLGKSAYEAHAGSFTGGANAVFWMEIIGPRPGGLTVTSNITEGAKRKVAKSQFAVETELLYPLLRGRDMERWSATPSAHILMMQDPVNRIGIPQPTVETKYPKAFSYLARHKKQLFARAAFKRYYAPSDPWWSMFNISTYTFSPWKVVWREQASEFSAAVVGLTEERVVIPDHKLMMVAARSKVESHFLCAALNSAPALGVTAAYAVQIQMDAHVLDNVSVPRFSAKNPVHVALAKLSEQAHVAAATGDSEKVRALEDEIDREAARLWGLSDQELDAIRASLEESRA